MKIKTIAKAFTQQTQGLDAPMIRTFKSIKDFKRRIDLLPAYKAIKEVYEEYVDERQKIIQNLIQDYCKKRNAEIEKANLAIADEAKHQKPIDPETIKELPDSMYKQFDDELKKIVDVDIELKRPFKFTEAELKAANLDIIELEILEDFFTINPDQEEKPE